MSKLIWILFACVIAAPVMLLRAQSQPEKDSLQPDSVWTGTLSGDERKPKQDSDRGATLRITSREGEKFEANLVVRGNQRFELALEGRIANGKVAAKVTSVVKGKWPSGTVDDLWTGAIQGDELILQHTSKQNLVSTAKLKLDEDAPRRNKRKNK